MKRSTTNRFLTNLLRPLCCIGALTAGSAWANVITWQPSASAVVAPKELSSSAYTNSVRGIETSSSTAAAVSFQSAPAAATVSESSAAPASVPSAALPSTEMASTQPQVSASNAAPDASLSVAAADTQAQPTSGAIAAAFDEEFVSVPTVQFATVAVDPAANVSAASTASMTAVPEMSAFFPIVGLIAAVSCTQILRRRRAVQKTAPIN